MPAKDQTYPGANLDSWYAKDYPGTTFDARCGVLHTTETLGLPGYGGGATAPNMTVVPNFARKRLTFHQHFPIDMSARALRNLSGGVETNRLSVCQVELAGTCDPVAHRRYPERLYWPEAPSWAVRDLAQFLAWCQREHGIPASSPVKGRWTPYPESYGPGGHRMSNAEWQRLRGWVGHQHVPENTHGDPGAFDFPALQKAVRAILTPRPATPAPVVIRPPIVRPPAARPPAQPTPPSPVKDDDPVIAYRTPTDPEAWQVAGSTLVYLSKARADALRAAKVDLKIVTLTPTDPLWKLSRAGNKP